jgi:heme-degrading monooxygenase HmoA
VDIEWRNQQISWEETSIMVVVVFRSRLREGVEQEIMKVGARMYELASSMPGFISYKDFAAEDGEGVAIVEFDSLENVTAWRDHPEHKEAQRQGREAFFSEYCIQVCELVRESKMPGV